ncbi:hypothetical protein JAAARDRAFT_617886 [Jaapia argillacea MUCL 33604]|uniref:Uncharacterized protein n=1 Tax=Jaapia argillacea MUCL 33604 TaxID=933084 RepID=A0A067P418_9AGAM|nr:hypothetical protein JAAARDRAFT_617886 [Jaapia argillacea MUCL 33604]
MFLYPIFRVKFANATVQKVASRTLVAAVMALITSSINLLVLTLMHGRQLGWVCLGSCGTDVVLNALVLFWVTSGAAGHSNVSHPSAFNKRSPHHHGGGGGTPGETGGGTLKTGPVTLDFASNPTYPSMVPVDLEGGGGGGVAFADQGGGGGMRPSSRVSGRSRISNLPRSRSRQSERWNVYRLDERRRVRVMTRLICPREII